MQRLKELTQLYLRVDSDCELCTRTSYGRNGSRHWYRTNLLTHLLLLWYWYSYHSPIFFATVCKKLLTAHIVIVRELFMLFRLAVRVQCAIDPRVYALKLDDRETYKAWTIEHFRGQYFLKKESQ